MSSRHVLAICLALAWILPGLVGHDPWKPDEAYTFGVVYSLLEGGSLLVPYLAGEPFLDKPPLLHYTAAATAWLLSPPLALHDAARLAAGFYMGLTLLLCGLTGRALHGRGAGTIAMLLLIGAFGLVIRSHQLITDVAALAGFALVYYGCARSLRDAWGALWLGTGIGIVFMAEGRFEAMLAAAIAVALVVHPAWRTRRHAATMALGALAALPWLAVWPALLAHHEPGLYAAWLAEDRATGFPEVAEATFYATILPWYAWPLWALGLWSGWRAFQLRRFDTAMALPVIGLAVSFVLVSLAPEKGELQALPLLLPLALLAAPGVTSLRRGASNGWYWFGVMGFTFFIVVAWFYWTALELGVPARLHAHLHRLQPGYTPGVKAWPLVIGLCYSVAWFVLLARLKRTAERPAIVWAAGVTVVWALAAVLFLGWVDTGKTYRGMVRELSAALPAQHRCIAGSGVGDSQRAMLHYFGNLRLRRIEDRPAACDLLLVQGRTAAEDRPAGAWRKIWEGSRPGDTSERFRLYQRTGS